jgi:hypothetical protein
MKTIQFTGTKNQLVNLKNAMDFTDNDMPQQVETRVYVVDGINYEFDTTPEKWDEEVFMNEAEIQGTVYSLEGFQKAHNNSEIDLEDCYIRFINIAFSGERN